MQQGVDTYSSSERVSAAMFLIIVLALLRFGELCVSGLELYLLNFLFSRFSCGIQAKEGDSQPMGIISSVSPGWKKSYP